MRNIILIIPILLLSFSSISQSEQYLSSICSQVSKQWKIDSNSCKGDRLKLSRLILNAKPDSLTKSFLLITLGTPNQIERVFIGYPERKNYVNYIYFIYMDECPKVGIQGAAIAFVFDESEKHFIRIESHDYCG